ncbi:unnamed protein product [Macrosiphum euphorbiae]|uniref:Ubiquitin-like protease family profile domain-containing protein n=1 Tax=Macrosiphum euphorbiae TaxID=13131 RepID=A0AAV0WH10_9HEMI|nr:unnamed protein product [Macrosiphum euphorbiae]
MTTEYPELTITRIGYSNVFDEVTSTDITSRHQINMDGVIVVNEESEDINTIDIENRNKLYDTIEITYDTDEETEQVQAEQIVTVNIDGTTDDIIDITSDTEEIEVRQIAPLVNLRCLRFIRDRKRTFPTYYKEKVFDELINILSNKTEDDILIPIREEEPIFYNLRVRDLMSLLMPKGWLKDSVVQDYLALVLHEKETTRPMYTDFLVAYKTRGYDNALKYLKNYNLNIVNTIVFPINPGGNHWALIVVEIWEGKMHVFDSLRPESLMGDLKLLGEFFNQALVDIINSNDSGVQRTPPANWIFIDAGSPKQENGHDCGVFTCVNARYFLTNTPRPMKFTQKYIPVYRQMIAWELMKWKLDS